MASATATAATKAPNIKALGASLDALNERVEALQREDQRLFELTDLSAIHTGPFPGTRADALRARARRPRLAEELAIALAERDDTTREFQAAADAEHRATRAAALAKMRRLLPELDRALAHVAELLPPIAALDAEARAGVVGPWAMFLPEPNRQSVLEVWRGFLKQEGLL